MLNKTPIWKYTLILAVIIVGSFYALPNLFGNDPGMQIRGTRGFKVDENVLSRVNSLLEAENIAAKSVIFDDKGLKLSFEDTETQLKARDIIEDDLDNNYTTALSLLSGAPNWLTDSGANPMFLGLDLRGGVHFLLEVDMDAALDQARNQSISGIKKFLQEKKLRYKPFNTDARGAIYIEMRKAEQRLEALDLLEKEFLDIRFTEDSATDAGIAVNLSEESIKEIQTFALEQNMTSLRNRVDQLGVAEPIVQRQGENRIVIQLPGVQDTARAKEILGRAATLEMRMVDEERNVEAISTAQSPPGSRLYSFRDGRRILLKKEIIYSGNNIVNAAASIDTQEGSPIVSITLDAFGESKNRQITGDNIGRRMAVVYVESVTEIKRDTNGEIIFDADGKPIKESSRIEDVLTAPVIQEQLGQRFRITGLDSVEEARDLALMLRSGSLAAPVEIIEERTVGPSLGQANISKGFWSVTIGFMLVLVFMLVYYRVFGVVANVALFLNLILMCAVLSLFQATLTLPGVAGIVLTVGMAVDANVLIFERIREEIRNGNSPQASIHMGYDNAFSTIVDANVTTLIAALVLFNFGTGPIKGFAVTLSIGIITSMFTAIIVTRSLINWFYGGKSVKKLSI